MLSFNFCINWALIMLWSEIIHKCRSIDGRCVSTLSLATANTAVMQAVLRPQAADYQLAKWLWARQNQY